MVPIVEAASVQQAINLLAGAVTANRVLRANGTNVVLAQITPSTDFAASVPLSLLKQTPISVTGAVTATINRVHSVAMTAAPATITLPTAVGVGDSIITIHILSTNTKTVTVDGDGTETIDGETSLTMHKNGTLTLVSDGTNWYSTVRNLAPGVIVVASSNSGQAVTGTSESVDFEDEAYDSHAAWDAAGTFTAPVSGVYAVSARVQGNADAFPMIYVGGALHWNGHNMYAAGTARATVSATVRLAAGDTVAIRMSDTITLTSTATDNTLRIVRVGDYA
jgi:hypothetical protein